LSIYWFEQLILCSFCRKTWNQISVMTVSLGMHTVGDETLKTTNDVQMTWWVSCNYALEK
jgi:hypothetical protein